MVKFTKMRNSKVPNYKDFVNVTLYKILVNILYD